MRSFVRLLALLSAFASQLDAQQGERVRTGAIFENYTFEDGSVVGGISQLTIPVAVDVALGDRSALVLSTGYVSVHLDSNDPAQLPSRTLSGPLDTELRLDYQLLPDRLVTFVGVTAPTGRQAVLGDQLGILVALANDAIGFSAPSLGSGGSVTSGFSAAVPIGRFALGIAASGVYSFAYDPVLTEPVSLTPGAEVRVRLGLEGALATRTYVRIVASGAARQKDELDGTSSHGLGHRGIAYLTLEHGIGPVILALYAFDVYRGTPQLQETALGSAILPRGNLLAVGGSLNVTLTAGVSFAPSIEYRVAAAAESLDTSSMLRQASSFRAGAEVRTRLSERMILSIRAQGAFGDVRQGATFYDFTGYRASFSLDVVP